MGIYPGDYKLSGDPKPFEVLFDSDSTVDDDGSHKFGTWIEPVATTKAQSGDVGADSRRSKILEFLKALRAGAKDERGAWATTEEVRQGAGLNKDVRTGHSLADLLAVNLVQFATKGEAKELGHSMNAKLWSHP